MILATAFVVFCLVCSVLAFVRHPIWGLYVYLATTYVFPPGRWWGVYFGDLRWSLLAAAVTICAILYNQRRLEPKPPWIRSVPAVILVLYSVWMWMQVPWAVDVPTHIEGATKLAKCLIAFWMVYRIVDSPERLRDLLFANLLGCTLLGLLGYQEGRVGDRLDGVGGPGMDDANTLGMYFAVAAVMGIGLALAETGRRRWITLICVAIVIDGLVLTNTRGAAVALVAGGLVLAWAKARAHRGAFWLLAAVGVCGMLVIIDKAFIERMSTLQGAIVETSSADESIATRIALAGAQLEMFRDYPLGSGHRGTQALSTKYLEKRWMSTDGVGEAQRSSHNTFLTALVEQGVPGAILFAWLNLWLLRTIWRLRREAAWVDDDRAALSSLTAAAAAGLAVVFVAGNTADFLLAEVQFWLFPALVAGRWFVAREHVLEDAPAADPNGELLPDTPFDMRPPYDSSATYDARFDAGAR